MSSTVMVGLNPKYSSVSAGCRYLSRSTLLALRCLPFITAWMAAFPVGKVLSASVFAAACISGVQRASSALFWSSHFARSSLSWLASSAFFFSSGVGSAGGGGALSAGGGVAATGAGAAGGGGDGATGGGSAAHAVRINSRIEGRQLRNMVALA